ncbi:hypothetical protein BGW38_010678 [Lunasporangiospora selenospora]|uniref:Glycosyltransferase sugar-binding region containing DXD motif-containing protein n=1 Tax=Lunasporangiospora selenospora TaxID=979761 RepID=A0A9P6KFD5_9FUNG|nr:hypothetical protein BGW38_010678 [Lunasporangiospora selenospora]
MPLVGYYKTIAILFVSLCTLASFFYLTVWSSITGPDSGSRRGQRIENDAVHHPAHLDAQLQEYHEEDEVVVASQVRQHDSYSQRPIPASTPSPKSTSKLALENKPIQLISYRPKDKAILKPKSEKQRAKELKKLAKLEREERKKQKEERKRRKEAKLNRLRKLEQEPFPHLISTNNARLAALNLRAFEKFCHGSGAAQVSSQDIEEKQTAPLLSLTRSKSSTLARVIHPDRAEKESNSASDTGNTQRMFGDGAQSASPDFESYDEWMEYIENKNSGQEQSQLTPSKSPSSSPQTSVRVKISRPQFMERPLRGWVVNMTAIQEFCDRTRYSSTQCLKYLAQEHLYLVPSRETRLFQNKMIFQQKQRHRYSRHRSHHHHHRLRTAQLSHLHRVQPSSVQEKDHRNPVDGSLLLQKQKSQPKIEPSNPAPKQGPLIQNRATTPEVSEGLRPHEVTSHEVDDNTVDDSDGNGDSHTSSNWMDFHIYWRGPITDKLALSARAFLFTQPLNRARLHLWIDSTELPGGVPEVYEDNPHSRTLVSEAVRPYIRFHTWNQSVQAQFAYGKVNVSEATGTNTPSVALSDEARFLILNRYGGMYLDADVLLLRDMSPFYDSGFEFAYEWSNTKMYNTAVLRLHRNGSVGRRILDGAKLREKELLEKKEGKKTSKEHGPKSGSSSDLKQTAGLASKSADGHSNGQENNDMHKLFYKTAPSTGAAQSMEAADAQDLSSQVRPVLKVSHQTPTIPEKEDSEEEGMEASEFSEDENEEYSEDSLFAPSIPTADDDDNDAKNVSAASQSVAHIAPHRLVKRGKFDSMRPKEIYHPARIRHYLRPEDGSLENNGLTMVPPAVFDPLWLRVDGVDLSQSSALNENSNPKDSSPSQAQDGWAGAAKQRNEGIMMPYLTGFPDVFSNVNAVCPRQSSLQRSQDIVPQQDELRQRTEHESEIFEKDVHDKEKDFSAGPEVFFMGAYAYHWHNNWKSKIEPQSWMGIMSRSFDQFLEGERPNLYGEWFRGGGVELDGDFAM